MYSTLYVVGNVLNAIFLITKKLIKSVLVSNYHNIMCVVEIEHHNTLLC